MQSELRAYSVRLDEPVLSGGVWSQEKAFTIPLNGGKVRGGLHRTLAHGIAGDANQDVAIVGLDAFGGQTIEDVLHTQTDVAAGDTLTSAAFNRFVVADEIVARLSVGNANSDVIATVILEQFFT